MKSIYILFFLGLFTSNMIAQSLNDYKYVIVPDSYEWAREIDKYQVNSLTTFLFKKYGFNAYKVSETLPNDVNANGCNTLTADVEENATLFRTKLKVILKDCTGEVVYVSQEGSSKAKEFKKAYHEALRNAFLSIEELKYSYSGPKESTVKKPNQQPTEASEAVENKTEPSTAVVQSEKETVAVSPKAKPEPEPIPVVEKDHYVSADGTYGLDVSVGSMVFYEGKKVIGTLTPKAAAFYQVETSEFSGKGYFENDQFIIEREIKGVQGIIKMIFEKE